MDSVTSILRLMCEKGVTLWVHGGQLCYRAPQQALTSVDIKTLRDRKTEIIESLQKCQSSAYELPILARLKSDTVPLTFQQQWLLGLLQNANVSNLPCGFALRLIGAVDIDSMRVSIEELIRRHESLRTRIATIDGVPRQHVIDPGPYELELVRLDSNSEENRENNAYHLAGKFVHQPLDLTVDPLFEIRLLRLSEKTYVLVVSFDHMISDGASREILLRDLLSLYSCAAHGRPPPEEARIQYADYAVWQHETNDSWMHAHGTYWHARLDGAKPIRFPVDRDIVAAAPSEEAVLPIRFGEALSVALRKSAQCERTTLTLLVLAVLIALMSRWCNENDLVIAFNTNGRHRHELANSIGYFPHLLHLRLELYANDTFRDLLSRVMQEYCTVYEHQDFARIVTRSPEFSLASFQWDPAPFVYVPAAGEFKDNLTIKPFPIRRAVTDLKFSTQISVNLSDSTQGVAGVCGYRADLFRSDTIARFIRNLRSFSARFIENPHARVTAVPYE